MPKKSLSVSPVPKTKSPKLPKTYSKNIKEYLQTRFQLKRNWQRLSNCRNLSNKKCNKLNSNVKASNGGKKF